MTEIRPIENLDARTRNLVRLARRAQKRAYAPYSRYKVGCVVVDKAGKLHTGCNVENATSPAGTCAERTAFFKMVSRGTRAAQKVVLVASSEEPVFPCGLCRQVIFEFAPQCAVIAVNRRASVYREATISELLPFGFWRRANHK